MAVLSIVLTVPRPLPRPKLPPPRAVTTTCVLRNGVPVCVVVGTFPPLI